ncbi:NAD(+) diphosphatase [uncultured Arthrobacter sp.]|uniref:NAD(+) diphosphatase n=1 Tax=uncultured Arthrobacter sp. TaxID=114050 RepID=UPI0026288469|nr:NAD(+) diphosphatase [uncultured Arthrobacter sp.]
MTQAVGMHGAGIASLPPLGSLPLARGTADRGSAFRTAPDLFDRLWEEPGTRVLHLAGKQSPVQDHRLVLSSAAEVVRPENPVYLGSTVESTANLAAGTHIVLVEHEDVQADLAPVESWLGLRDAAASLPALESGLFVEAVAISNWHATHTHCPRCGHRTESIDGGWVRRCPADESLHYPRTDPAIIVTVTDEEDRLLLGSSAAWPENRFSTLAGFVEPGESLEAAVVREIEEESGIVVHSPTYLGSQPWPFPASLMLGFTAKAAHARPVPDGVEIREVRWFSRDELFTGLKEERLSVASGASIARALIEHWYGGPLDEEPSAGRP